MRAARTSHSAAKVFVPQTIFIYSLNPPLILKALTECATRKQAPQWCLVQTNDHFFWEINILKIIALQQFTDAD